MKKKNDRLTILLVETRFILILFEKSKNVPLMGWNHPNRLKKRNESIQLGEKIPRYNPI